jgi:hypothetical protein
MGTTPDHRWLQHFWDEVVVDDRDRIWELIAMHNAEVWLRDGYAWARLRERLLGRGPRFHCAHVRAWAVETQIADEKMKGRDIIFLGRSKAYESSRYAPYAHLVGSKAHARFVDIDGRLGDTVMYGKRRFTRQEFDPSPDQLRRVKVDYGMVAFRRGDVGFDKRRLLVIAGLSSLGTLCMTLLLVDDGLRQRLVEQVRELLPWDPKLRPDESFEICVRVDVESEQRSANFLNEPIFKFTVETVAIGDGELRLREDRGELVLHPRGNGRPRDTVSAPGTAEVALTRTRFALLQALVVRDGAAAAEELCHDCGLLHGGESQAMVKRKKGLVARIVHDLNHTLGPLLGLQHGRLIQMQDKRYVLTGFRGVVRS